MKKMTMKRLISLVLTLAMLGSLLVLPAGAVNLKDLEGHWAKDVIQFGVDAGYINGYTDGTFRPDDVVTRAQFAKMLNNAIGVLNTTSITFPDTPANQWYYADVCKAVAAQYINGYTDGKFRPDSTITRQEAAVMLSRIVTAPKESKITNFTDADKVEYWAKDSVNMIFSKGYIQGDTRGNFNPTSSLTRAQAAKIIYELLKGEKIVKNADESILENVQDAIFVNNATVNAAAPVQMNNCRVLGTLNVAKSSATINNSTVNHLAVNAEGLTVSVAGKTVVKDTEVKAGTTLAEEGLTGEGFQNVTMTDKLTASIVQLLGTFDKVTMQGGTVLNQNGGTIKELDVANKSNITMQRGTIDHLTVEKTAAESTLIFTNGVSVSEAVMDGKAAFRGEGRITKATENVEGCTYETAPANVVTNYTKPVEPSKTVIPTIVPASGATNVAVDGPITVVFPEAMYDLSGQRATAVYFQNNVIELRANGLNGAKLSTVATLNGNSVVIRPAAPMTNGAGYTVSVLANTVQNAEGVKNLAATSYFTVGASNVAGNMTPAVKPADGSVGVSTSAGITLDFGTVIFNNTSTTLTPAYVENAVELHTGSAAGTRVPCTASISSDRTSVTLNPDIELSINTSYYVVIKAGAFHGEGNKSNPAVMTSFTTGNTSTLVPTSVYPTNNSLNVNKSSRITITFPEAVYQSAGVTVTANYIRDNAIELRKGSMSGSLVSYSAVVSNDQRTITLTPAVVLDANTTYYLVIKKDTLVTMNGGSNSGFTSTFSTGMTVESNITFDPVKDTRYVQVSSPVTVTFPEAIRQPDFPTLPMKASYLENNAIEMRLGGAYGNLVPFTATISADGKTVTLKPNNDMTPNATYYVAVVANKLVYPDGSVVGAASTNFTTTDVNPITITMGETTGSTAKFSVKSSVAGNLTVTAANKTLVGGITVAADEEREFTLDSLSGGVTYSIYVTLNYQGTNYTRNQTFMTSAVATTAKLQEITLMVGSDMYQPLKIDPLSPNYNSLSYQTSFQVTPMVSESAKVLKVLPSEPTVASVQYAIGSANTFKPMTKDADGYYTLSDLTFNKGYNNIYIRVTAANGTTTTTYTLNVNWNS